MSLRITALAEHRLSLCVDDPKECWLWQGSVNSKGYGSLRVSGKVYTVHRLYWLVYVNPDLDTDLRLDHLCLKKRCFNPDHLEEVSDTVNNRRNQGWTDIDGTWYCPNNHEVSGYNEMMPEPGKFKCRVCTLSKNRTRYNKRKFYESIGL